MPRRWPKQSGVKMSMTRTPVLSAVPTRCLRKRGRRAAGKAGRRAAELDPPSIGRPSASTTRPRHAASGATRNGPRLKTASPTPASALRSNGATST